jgi:creatinine amidohydrolase/Fe(II)-dependent formamide hydrolase-like protein
MMRPLAAVLVAGALIAAASPAATQVVRVGDLNTAQIRGLDRAKTAVFLSGGILEEHGPYLPAYTDGVLSSRLTQELAQTVVRQKAGWTALLFPQIPLGASGSNELGGHFVFPGTYAIRPSTLRAIFMDLADELGQQGFRWIVVVHVHGAPLHNRALDQASDYFHETYAGRMVHLWGMVPVLAGWGSVLGTLSAAEKQEDGVSLHGGLDETSLMLHLQPDLVSPEYRNAPIVTGKTLEESFRAAARPDWPGYLGSPRLATAAMGERIWSSFSAAAARVMLAVLDGGDPGQYQRYADLLARNPLYQGWFAAAGARDSTRDIAQRDWLRRRPPDE